MKYIAAVKWEGKIEIIERDTYTSKKAFAADLRANGYKVRFISTEEKFDEDCTKYHERIQAQTELRRYIKEAEKKTAQKVAEMKEEGEKTMLRTNSKAARQNVQNYITESAAEYIAECYELPTEGKQIFSSIAEIYRQEYRKPMTQANFTAWAQGLPCGRLFDYYLHSAVDTLGNILQESEEERSRFTEEQAERTLSYLIYREVERNS